MNKISLKLLIIIVLLPIINLAQNNQAFYEHYTGLISEDLKITADLVKMENSFSGFYYYQFKEEGAWKSSKPIALDGQVGADYHFVLNEFGESHSFFQGVLETSKLIKGEWINDMLKDPVNFTFKATYSKGSIPMKALEFYETKNYNGEIDKPRAKYHLSALFPSSTLDQAVYHQLIKRIYHLMGYRGEISKQTDIITSLKELYFRQFQLSLDNIKLDSFPKHFNWEKSIRMDVINNEGGLLCIQVETYAKTGAQEGSKIKKYLVFNISENKVIKLKDLLYPDKEEALNKLLQEKLRTHYHINSETPLSEAGFFQDNISASNNFYIHPGGIGFYYNIYEIAPFSNGPTDLFIPWEDLQDIIEALF